MGVGVPSRWWYQHKDGRRGEEITGRVLQQLLAASGPPNPPRRKHGHRPGPGSLGAVEVIAHYLFNQGLLPDTAETVDALMRYAQEKRLPHADNLEERSLGAFLAVAVAALKMPD